MPPPHPQLFHFSGQCFLRFSSKNPPSNYLPSRAHGGTLTTNALEKKGTDGSFIAHLEMFPRLLFSSPIHSCSITRICQLQCPEAAAEGPGPPGDPARGRALAVARSPAREGGSAARTPTAGVGMGLRTDAGFGSLAAPGMSANRRPLHTPQVRGRQEQQLQNNAGCTGDASTPDAPRVPPSSGVGEEKPDGDNYRAPKSFPFWSGNVGNGAAGDGGRGPSEGLRVRAQTLASRPREGGTSRSSPAPSAFRGQT